METYRKKAYGAIITPAYDHTFNVTMCGQDADGVYRPLRMSNDYKSKQNAAYLQRKSDLHQVTDPARRNYEVQLYDYIAQRSVQSTSISSDTTVYIAGAEHLLRTQVVEFLHEILFAVNNADIKGSLRVFYVNLQSPTSRMLFKDITTMADLQNVCRLACAC